MASPTQQLETERWRVQAQAMARLEALLSACVSRLEAADATIAKQADLIAALSARESARELAASRHPLRQTWDSFLAGDWRVKLAFVAPPLLLAYAFFAGQSLPALASDILTTARICATGRPESIHAP